MVDQPAAGLSLGLPALYTLFVWWSSTGVILYLDSLPRRTYRFSLAGATALLALALYGIAHTAQRQDAASAYAAFTCALVVWGWVEMAFLMGYVVGPRTAPCPPASRGWRRAALAVGAILYHELALLACMGVIAALAWRAPNPLAAWTFAALWVSRQSAKLNLFLGARNFSEQFLPEHLRYIATYFARRPMNPLFPFSVSVGSIVAAQLWWSAAGAATDAQLASCGLLASLVTLGTLEHWFLILPINADRLWEWSRAAPRSASIALRDDTAHDPVSP